MEKHVQLGWLLDRYGSFLTERQQTLLHLHVNEDLSLAEIAEQAGISRQGVHDALKRGEEQLLEYEARLGMLRLQQEAQARLSSLLRSIETAQMDEQEKTGLKAQVSALLQLLEDGYGV